jgi:hypothetical protein
MNTKLTLLTVITLTAAITAGGTYYLTTNAPVSTVETQPSAGNPVQVAVNQDSDKPITIIVKTEISEKQGGLTEKQIGHIRDLKQPHLEVMQTPTIPLNNR